jgi:hypothetical protein
VRVLSAAAPTMAICCVPGWTVNVALASGAVVVVGAAVVKATAGVVVVAGVVDRAASDPEHDVTTATTTATATARQARHRDRIGRLFHG